MQYWPHTTQSTFLVVALSTIFSLIKTIDVLVCRKQLQLIRQWLRAFFVSANLSLSKTAMHACTRVKNCIETRKPFNTTYHKDKHIHFLLFLFLSIFLTTCLVLVNVLNLMMLHRNHWERLHHNSRLMAMVALDGSSPHRLPNHQNTYTLIN